ncbi:hypothetical protein CIB87_28475 (plasmid) [Priestia megaterium]|uniref:Uncharacterized protein n=2 Tax=Priestia megaterium TaxID=1404 RepID=A0AA86I6M1_PRIMG|nr:hypothetical protein [Priestia megaterium]AXI32875.1 hypothetical protein CIB87_28420 [Priestia megaterium]AXI32884.1 hypothetical protein CIB87_28475 [Priestia megaterium]
MKKSRLILMMMVLLSWSSLLFLGRRDFKKYLPAALFIGAVTKITNKIAKKRKWWRFEESIHPKISGDDTWAWGLFFPSTLWILKLSFGKIWSYVTYNLILHTSFVYLLLSFLKKLKIVSLVKLSKRQYLLVLFCREILLYLFQFSKEYIERKKPHSVSVNGKSQDRQVENLRS